MQKLMTAVAAALVFTISLKGLHLFKLIKWNPIHFLQKIEKVEWTPLACWMVLFFILLAVAYVLLTLFQLSIFRSPLVVSIVFGSLFWHSLLNGKYVIFLLNGHRLKSYPCHF